MGTGRGQVLVWAAAAVLGTLALARILDGRDEGHRAAAPVRVDGGEVAARRGGGAKGGAGGYVHVAGRVRRPGLYRLSEGARVASALDRAGGPARGANLAAVNLAARLEDGQQIQVPQTGASSAPGAPAAAGPGAAAGGAAGAKLSLASATVEQLDQLDGIGPTLAKRIVEYRDAHGGFRSVDELDEVDGIGEKRLRALREAVGP
jgi:competence protein ComEA